MADALPTSTTYVGLLGIALLATLLANLLWRRSLVRHDVRPSLADFHRVSLVATPLSLVAAVTTLWMVT